MAIRQLMLIGTAAVLCAGLSACNGREGRAELAELDDGLTGNDPAVRGSLGDEITVDPALTGSNNRAAAGPGARPVDGAVPAARAGGTAAAAAADARAAVGGTMMPLPAPARFEDSCTNNCDARQPVTLGERARGAAGGACDAQLSYGADWAQRMPATFPVYPRAALREAAGVQTGNCNVRVVNFQSRAGMDNVLAWYYTRARRAGYTAEHLVRGSNEHFLGGTRGREAFVVIARPMSGGVVDVDVVASGGS